MGKKGRIQKYSQPKLGALTDAEAMISDSENPQIQSCDEGLLDMSSSKRGIKKRRKKKKGNVRRLNHVQSFKPDTNHLHNKFKGSRSEFFEVYKKNAKEDTKVMKKKMRTLKEVEQTLKFINQGKEEIESYVRGRGSLESQRRKREIVRLPNNRSQVDLREQSKMGQRIANASRQRRLSKGEIQGLIEKERERSDLLRKKMVSRKKYDSFKKQNLSPKGTSSYSKFSRNIKRVKTGNKNTESGGHNKKNMRRVKLDNLEESSKTKLKSKFENLKFPSFGSSDYNLGESDQERLSLPVKKSRKEPSKISRSAISKGMTPLIKQSPTLKLIRNSSKANRIERVNKKTFEEFIKSQRERRREAEIEQRSESVESGLENSESQGNHSTIGFGLRTIPGKKNGVRKVNQDSAFFETKILGYENLALFGVFDGHGPQGHRVSRFLVKHLLGNRLTLTVVS